jgi:hypothetical protein
MRIHLQILYKNIQIKIGISRCNFNTKNSMFIYIYVIIITILSIKDKIMNITLVHPKLLSFGVALGLMFVI